MKKTNFFNNKTVILITIFIVLILIILLACSMNKEYFTNSKNKEIHYYSLSTCPHCIDFDPVWKQFENETKFKKFVVDKDDKGLKNAELYNVSGYPTIIVVENDKVIEEVNDRTCGGLRKACKNNNIPCTVVC